MQIRVRIEFEGMQRVESVKHEVGADSVMVAGLKRTIMNIGGIDIPMDVVSLYRDDSVAPVKELDDDEIVSGDGDTVFLWMRIPRPHVVYKMSLPGEQVLIGDIYVKTETINVADVANELRKRCGVTFSDVPIIVSLQATGTPVLSPTYEFRKEATHVYSQLVLDGRNIPAHYLPRTEVYMHNRGVELGTFEKVVDRFTHTCRWENDFFEIPHNIAYSVFQIDDRVVLHRRRAVDDLYHSIDRCNLALVTGPPGSGKSTCMFARALSRASEYKGGAIMWIGTDYKRMSIISNSEIHRYDLESITSWVQLMDFILNDDKFNFCEIYVDQCRLNHQKVSDDCDLLRKLVNQWAITDRSRRLFAITSEGCNDLKRSGFQNKDIIELKGWTLDEYRAVLRHDVALDRFLRSLQQSDIVGHELEKQIELKFYYAGISARFFFDYTIKNIKLVIEKSLDGVSSFDSLFEGNMGTASAQAVNLLFHKTGVSSPCSSRYIADKLLESNKVGPQTFADMVTKLGYNPNRGGVGVLFELYTLAMIQKVRWNPILKLSGKGLPYTIPAQIHSKNLRMRHYKPDRSVHLENWYKPFKPSNPGYDAFYAFGNWRKDNSNRLENLVIVFLQVKCGARHECNPQHFATAALGISNRIEGYERAHQNDRKRRRHKSLSKDSHFTKLYIEIVYAVPTGRKKNFVVQDLDVFVSLENLDDRWSDRQFVIFEVPKSSSFLAYEYDDISDDEFF